MKIQASVFALFKFFRGHYAALFPESFQGSRRSSISRLKTPFFAPPWLKDCQGIAMQLVTAGWK
jgi:hypothetical protein